VRPALTHLLRNSFLGKGKLFHEPLISHGLLHGVEILALQVLNKGNGKSRLGIHLVNHRRNGLLARELGVEGARLLLLHNPTAGLDAGGVAEVLERIVRLADSGVAVLMATPSIDEAIAVADRVLVWRGGRVVAEFERGVTSEEVAKALLA
jgi:ABC-type lipopolysaccharide export system ATPase subunit